MPIQIICSECSGTQVSREAWADWDEDAQEWRLGLVLDDGHCHDCARAVVLKERTLLRVVRGDG